MTLKNYTTTVPASRSIEQIMQALSANGADLISVTYCDKEVDTVSFAMTVSDKQLFFKLPARVSAVEAVLKSQKVKNNREHAYNVAWRNVRDWVMAQMALVETQQAQVVEVMMPYMLDGHGSTIYESFVASNNLLPEGGEL